MADDPIVQDFKVTGIDTATKQFVDYGKAGADALKTQQTEADKLAASLSKADKEAKQLSDDIAKAGKAAPVSPAIGSMDRLAASASRVSAGFDQMGRSANVFRERATRVFKIATAAVGGFIAATALIAKSLDDAGKAQGENTDNQIRALNNNNALAAAERQHGSSLRQLRAQLVAGTITYEQYSASVQDTNRAFVEQRREMFAAQDAERALAEDTKRLQQAQAKQDALNSLIDKFGGPLTNALVTAGRASLAFLGDLQRGLGPPVAAIIDKVVALFERNRTAIVGFLDAVGKKLNEFAAQGGVEDTFNAIGKAISAIASFVTGALIPAFASLKPVLDGVATAMNAIFGTQLTGGAVAIIVVLGLFTKSFSILLGAANVLIGALGLLFNAIGRLVALRALIPLMFNLATIAVRGFLVALGPIGIAIAAISVALAVLHARGVTVSGTFELLRKAAIIAVFEIQQGFTKLIAFFANIGVQIGLFFTNLWEATKAKAEEAVTAIVSAFGRFVAFIAGLPATIGSLLASLWENAKQGVLDAVAFITEQWNTFVAFLQSLPATIGAVFLSIGASIQQAFTDAIAFVIGKFNELLAAAKRFIQPVIDMLKTLSALLGSAEGAASGGGVGGAAAFAGGGGVRGPGTGTSDDILAWLSNGEYVIRAKAVAKYGRAFMNSINSGRFDLSKLKGFAMGGMVGPAPVLRFAGGGEVAGQAASRVLNLTIGQDEFKGLSAPEDVAQKMVKFAVKKQTRRAGRTPSWHGR